MVIISLLETTPNTIQVIIERRRCRRRRRIITILTGSLPALPTIPLSVDRLIATQGPQESGFVIAINRHVHLSRRNPIGIFAGLDRRVGHPDPRCPALLEDPTIVFNLRVLRPCVRSDRGGSWATNQSQVTLTEAFSVSASRSSRTDLDTTTELLARAVAENARGRPHRYPPIGRHRASPSRDAPTRPQPPTRCGATPG